VFILSINHSEYNQVNFDEIKKAEPLKLERVGDVKHSLADISRARAIGYEPQYSRKDGLRETIKGTGNAK